MKKRICGSTPKLGFTLAEILITLSIIGVVAALTIPTLIQRTGDEEIVSKLNKAYSTLSQATETIITERGGVKTWASNIDTVYQIYKEHLRIARDCGSAKGCFSQLTSGGYPRLSGQKENNWDTNTGLRKFILSDGVQAAFGVLNTQCGYSWAGSTKYCQELWVDVNGKKAPNIIGRDVFLFVIKETGLYPAGCDNESAAECKADGHGHGCACKVISEGAMNY